MARILTIYTLEEGLEIPRDLIYTTALLHDIGRCLEHENGTPHDQASVEIATELLAVTDFSKAEQEMILTAIEGHRKANNADLFSELFYRADKTSRLCFRCPAKPLCNWPEERKNKRIII